MKQYLYLVTDEALCLHHSLEDVVSAAVKGGIGMVQIREKELNTREFISRAKALRRILTPSHIPLIINDRVDVALAVEASGVHIGQTDMPYPLARKLLGKNAIIGISVENEEQVLQANDWDVDYIAASPVFETATKTDIVTAWGLDGIQRIRQLSKHTLVGIGGLNSSNIKATIHAGLDSVAVVSAICSSPDPQRATEELCRLIDKG